MGLIFAKATALIDDREKDEEIAGVLARLESLEAERIDLERRLGELQRRPAPSVLVENPQ